MKAKCQRCRGLSKSGGEISRTIQKNSPISKKLAKNSTLARYLLYAGIMTSG